MADANSWHGKYFLVSKSPSICISLKTVLHLINKTYRKEIRDGIFNDYSTFASHHWAF